MLQFFKMESKLNIYFSGSITGGRKDQSVYGRIVGFLKEKGHDAPTAYISLPNVLNEEAVTNAEEVYLRDI